MSWTTMSESERFWNQITKTESCWLWNSKLSDSGYGSFRPQNGKQIRAHRYSYSLLVGPIPDGMTLDHLCRNRACVRPDHLEPVSNEENVMRGEGIAAVNARKTHCKRGHEFTPENTYQYTNRNGKANRVCRACSLAHSRQQKLERMSKK